MTAATRAGGLVFACLLASGMMRAAAAQTVPAAATAPTDTATKVTALQAATDTAFAETVQADASTSDFDKMRTPDSPAFVILGVSPTEIQRPGTPMAVATALSGFVSGSSVTIPTNLALEVAPYWLYDHPQLTSKAYQEGGWRNVYRTFTLSLATKQSSRDTTDMSGTTVTHSDTDLALGARARLYSSGPDRGAHCVEKLEALTSAATELSVTARLSDSELTDLASRFTVGSTDYKNAFQAAMAKKIAGDPVTKLQDAQKNLDKKCFDVTASAQGFSLDLAGAIDWTFPDSVASASNSNLISRAGWLSGAYASDRLTGILLARYVGLRSGTDWQQVFDAGLRLVFKRPTFGLSAEGIARLHLSGPGDDTYKVDLAAEYEFGNGTWVTVTFGRSFTAAQAGSLFSLANLSWSFGKPSI